MRWTIAALLFATPRQLSNINIKPRESTRVDHIWTTPAEHCPQPAESAHQWIGVDWLQTTAGPFARPQCHRRSQTYAENITLFWLSSMLCGLTNYRSRCTWNQNRNRNLFNVGKSTVAAGFCPTVLRISAGMCPTLGSTWSIKITDTPQGTSVRTQSCDMEHDAILWLVRYSHPASGIVLRVRRKRIRRHIHSPGCAGMDKKAHILVAGIID